VAAMDINEAVTTGPIEVSIDGPVAYLRFNRPEKRNAINDSTIAALAAFLDDPPRHVRCVVLSGAGDNFSAGLDLSEHVQRQAETVFQHSRGWHRTIEQIQHGGLPFVALLTGAVMGGGLEIAAACHVRIAEAGARFRMPEGQRGIFVGGGATANLSRLIGASRLIEMMLTGRTYDAAEALDIGMVHYLTESGRGQDLAEKLAHRVAENPRLVNALIVQGVSRIADMSRADGLFAESLAAALSTTSEDAVEGLNAFLEKRKPMFK
jgi:(methylthio)acryloyl-CoA hydratase